MKLKVITVLFLVLGLNAKGQTAFDIASSSKDWNLVLKDKGTKEWTKNWTLDGKFASVENSQKGMHFIAGPELRKDAHHAVLWTKESYDGDIKIEYDYTRTDNENRWVNILYIQATGDGEGEYETDIAKWAKLREVPAMKTYFENMNALHISYAAFGNEGDGTFYVRARRYPKPNNKSFDITRISPSYDQKGYFKSGQTYHITVVKADSRLSFKMESKDGEEFFTWDLSKVEPMTSGRIGLRHMYGRSAIYRNFKVYTK
ncbi:protein of unknown function [Spirosomataceae bacterium TFI 002]|nr:protein of unknown function [Spirosomataceae bacterium TFI 002]